MTVVDLASADLAWLEHTISGSDKPARMVMLHADAETNTRTVMVEFPPGWVRDAVGHQPAGEEMVILSGELSISGQTAATGDYLLVEPRATRSATSVADGTAALVWFSGPGGGWADGADADPGGISVRTADSAVLREPSDRMPGSVEVYEDLAARTFPADVGVVWTESREWAHVPAGTEVPVRPGRAVVRIWS